MFSSESSMKSIKENGIRTHRNIQKIKRVLKYHMGLEIYLGTINNNLAKVLGKWSTLYNHLNK